MSAQFDQLILKSMPHQIAVEYQKLLEAQGSQQKIDHALRVYELSLRACAICLISQYLIRDADRISDPILNQLLLTKLPNATLDVWQQVFFSTLKTYEGKRDLLFMPELYDIYWDRSSVLPQPCSNIEVCFTRLTQIRNDLRLGAVTPANSTDWEKLCSETLDLLHNVLDQFVFLQNYTLIRVIKLERPGVYWYDEFTGLEVSVATAPLSTELELTPGWFYFSKQMLDFLELHPLLIFWDEPRSSLPATSSQKNAAIYDHFMSDRLKYLLANVWESVTAERPVSDFVRLLYYTVEQVKKERLQVDRLTWGRLQVVARSISDRRMSSVMGKYRRDLYLQRSKTKTAFDEFLKSDKSCFVLTGKSGVGKSNFMLALMEEYIQKRPDICLLMYNGAKLDPKEALTTTVGRDFENHLQITGRSDEEFITNIWREIERIENISMCKVVLCIDAINENAEAKAVLRQVDELVEGSPWPWLKIVVTSRSEAWRVMKRGIQLAEAKYYRESSEDQLGVELEPFSYSQQIEPFTQYELPQVYEKYCGAYKLQTAYGDLPYEVKQVLRDPLVLRLVADTHQGRQIPASIKVEDIYQNYISHLITTGRLTQSDVYFFEQELLPLMIGKGHYSNTIADREIDQSRTSDGRSLFELIHSDALLSNGQRVNQSYTNLVDSEILVKHGLAYSYEIGFKYERFYDYFAAKRLEHLLQDTEHSLREYQSLLLQLTQFPFIWGAVQHVITGRLRENNLELVTALAYQTNQTSQKMIAEVLSEYGKSGTEEFATVKSVIASLAASRIPSLLNQKIVTKEELVAAKLVAIEVATTLRVPEILIRASGDRNPTVRTVTIRCIADIWQSDTKVGQEIFSGLTKAVVRRVFGIPIPNQRVLETLFASGVLILTQNYRELQAVSSLRDVAREGIDAMLPISLDSPLGGLINQFAYSLLAGIFLSAARRITSQSSQYAPANFEEMSAYFSRPKYERAMIQELLPVFYEPGTILEHVDLLRRAVDINDPMTNWVVYHILAKHSIKEPFATVKIISELFERQISSERPSHAAAFLLEVFAFLLTRTVPSSTECQTLFTEFEQLVKRYEDKTRCRVHYQHQYMAEELSSYVRVSYTLFRQVNLEFVHEALLRACHEGDWQLLDAYARGFRLLGTVYPYPALNSLIPLLPDTRENVVNALVNTLARIRLTYPEEVEDLLASHKHSQKLRDRLTIASAEEKVMDLFLVSAEEFFFNGSTSDDLLDAGVLVLGQMPHAKNYKEWFSMVGVYIVDLMFQSRVLKIKMLPVDVGHKVIRNPFE